MILDIHTHLRRNGENETVLPRKEAIVSCSPEELPAMEAFPAQCYSVGTHPWLVKSQGIDPAARQALLEAAQRPDVVAIGETGIDTVHAGSAPLFAQMNAFRTHVEISEALGKPLIIHSVKAQEIIIGIHKELRPSQPWIIHGFRGKPGILQMYLRAGIAVSYGERFNPESLLATPAGMLYAETDESKLSIEAVIKALNAVRPDVDRAGIADNTRRLLNM